MGTRTDEGEATDKRVKARNWVIVLGVLAVAQIALLWWFGLLPGLPRPGEDVREARWRLSTIASAVDRYRLEHRAWPPDLAALTGSVDDRGEAYLERLPDDPWGRPHRFTVIDRVRFDLRSAGPDGVMDTVDDVVAGSGR